MAPLSCHVRSLTTLLERPRDNIETLTLHREKEASHLSIPVEPSPDCRFEIIKWLLFYATRFLGLQVVGGTKVEKYPLPLQKNGGEGVPSFVMNSIIGLRDLESL